MADDSDNSERPTVADQSAPQGTLSKEEVPQPTPSPSSSSEDRSELLHRARAFLASPDVVHEAPATKRHFLSEKGLRGDEIGELMRELPPQLPPIPPRTYPQPPPSKLPYLLLGLTRIFTWLTGSSIVLIFLYYRLLLPRLTRSALARRTLKQNQISLLKRLNASLSDLKETQAETLAVLPTPPVAHEPAKFTEVHSLDNLGLDLEAPIVIPEFTLLRCAIEGLAAQRKKATKEELFSLLEERYAWLKTDESLAYQDSLWETLTSNSCFSEINEDSRLVWTYTPPSPPELTPFLSALTTLKFSFPPPRTEPSPYQRTLDALTDFTGYITTQTYQLASGTMHAQGFSGFGSTVPLSPQQEEVKKEIRTLKGLVLNRRTFAPTATRPPSYGSAP